VLIQIGQRQHLDMTDRLGTKVAHDAVRHTVVDQVHDPCGKCGNEGKEYDSFQIEPHLREIDLVGCNDLIDRIAEQDRNIKL
jgi:hypothetical protein